MGFKMFNLEYTNSRVFLTILGFKIKFTHESLLPLIRLIDLIVPKKRNKVAFCINYSNISASLAYYEYLAENHGDEFELVILSNKQNIDIGFPNVKFAYSFSGIYNILTSKYIVVAHANVRAAMIKSSKHVCLMLTHGMPIKKIGFTMPKNKRGLYPLLPSNMHCFVTSDIFKQAIISCFRADYENVYITGSARNDLIGKTINDNKIKEIFELENFSKVIFYMPTFKSSKKVSGNQITTEFNNIFYLNDYDEKDFVKLLEDNNILFIMKPHPVDEPFYRKNLDKLPQTKNFKIVYNGDFYLNKFQSYEVFKFVDLMISDYSSAPLDYLILNKPVLYLNSLVEDYCENRGMVLEDNFEILMPGKKVTTYLEFKQEMLNNIYLDAYKLEREKSLPLIHKYLDFNSSERIYNIMKNL